MLVSLNTCYVLVSPYFSEELYLSNLPSRLLEDFLADRRPTSRETEMPYFKPFPVADGSAL